MPPPALVTENLLAAIGVSTIAAALLALLARRIGQPLILGYIVGGALLGPQLGLASCATPKPSTSSPRSG